MNIGIINHFGNIESGRVKGGGTNHLYRLVQLWRKKGEIVKLLNKNVISFSLISMIHESINILFSKNYLENENFDIILVGSIYPPDFIFGLKSFLKLRKPVIIYFHHIPPPLTFHPIRRGLLRVITNIGYTKLILSISKIFNFGIFLDQPEEYNIGSAKIFKDEDSVIVMHKSQVDSVDLKNDKINDFDILVLSRVSKNKGTGDIINVMKIVREKNLKLVHAGDIGNEKYYTKLIKKIKKLNLESQITFLGYVTEDEKEILYKKAKIFLYPSYEEGWSLAVMDAAFYGVPIVAYDLQAYSYLKGNLFKVTPGNVKELAEAIEKCLNNKEIREKYVKNAIEEVLKYDYEKIAEYQLNVFRNFIDESS
ncbi:MAG: glycosyltransferase family 4 protein [Thermoplasmata archaeon]